MQQETHCCINFAKIIIGFFNHNLANLIMLNPGQEHSLNHHRHIAHIAEFIESHFFNELDPVFF